MPGRVPGMADYVELFTVPVNRVPAVIIVVCGHTEVVEG